jgi:hypothetical protein
MRSLLLSLLLLLPYGGATVALAAPLATIQSVLDSDGKLVFGVVAVNGIGSSYSVSSPLEDVIYSAPKITVDLMYAMVSNPAQYTSRGPLWVRAEDWTQDYSALGSSHGDFGLHGYATITAYSSSVLSIPWYAVTLREHAGVLSVGIFSGDVPEPSSMGLLFLAAFFVLGTFGVDYLRKRS